MRRKSRWKSISPMACRLSLSSDCLKPKSRKHATGSEPHCKTPISTFPPDASLSIWHLRTCPRNPAVSTCPSRWAFWRHPDKSVRTGSPPALSPVNCPSPENCVLSAVRWPWRAPSGSHTPTHLTMLSSYRATMPRKPHLSPAFRYCRPTHCLMSAPTSILIRHNRFCILFPKQPSLTCRNIPISAKSKASNKPKERWKSLQPVATVS